MADFILELYSEEIPARMQGAAARQLETAICAVLSDHGVSAHGVAHYSAPQRLAVLIDDLPDQTPDRTEERKGPRIDAPEKAISGFLQANGLADTSGLTTRDDGKGAYYVLESHQQGQAMSAFLAGHLPDIINSFNWPKSMRWGSRRLRWVRPLRAILCRLNGVVIDFEVDGLTSGGVTRGHRFLAPAEIEIKHAHDYIGALEKAFVLVDPAIRESMIIEGASELARAQGCALVEDMGLAKEVAGLVEWPVPLCGTIDPDFMDVPDELLTSVMRTHQKYFSVYDPATKRLAPYFITVSNMQTPDEGALIRSGNERVLRARLSDGKFFWDQDRKQPLAERLPALDAITFHARLGTVGDKSKRIAALAQLMAPAFSIDEQVAARAGLLAKADLVSGVVFEFPELQGVMGGYYARHDGEGDAIGQAISEHYAPLGPSDAIPASPCGQVVALADKIDTLTGFWRINEKPTGSKDPYALRRAALGVLRILLENRMSMNLRPVLLSAIAAHQLPSGDPAAEADLENAVDDLLGFLRDRLSVYLKDRGLRYDVVAATMSADDDDICAIVDRGQALADFLDTSDGANLLAAFTRADGILQKSDLADHVVINPDIFETKSEALLFQTIETVRGSSAQNLPEFLTALAQLRSPVDAFFTEVMVNVEDKAVRVNRLALLHSLKELMSQVGNLSLINK